MKTIKLKAGDLEVQMNRKGIKILDYSTSSEIELEEEEMNLIVSCWLKQTPEVERIESFILPEAVYQFEA